MVGATLVDVQERSNGREASTVIVLKVLESVVDASSAGLNGGREFARVAFTESKHWFSTWASRVGRDEVRYLPAIMPATSRSSGVGKYGPQPLGLVAPGERLKEKESMSVQRIHIRRRKIRYATGRSATLQEICDLQSGRNLVISLGVYTAKGCI